MSITLSFAAATTTPATTTTTTTALTDPLPTLGPCEHKECDFCREKLVTLPPDPKKRCAACPVERCEKIVPMPTAAPNMVPDKCCTADVPAGIRKQLNNHPKCNETYCVSGELSLVSGRYLTHDLVNNNYNKNNNNNTNDINNNCSKNNHHHNNVSHFRLRVARGNTKMRPLP